MSKYNNVNPDHYKLAGRERPGKTTAVRARAKSTEEEERARWAGRAKAPRKNKDVEGPKAKEEAPRSANEEAPRSKPDAGSPANRRATS
jgi:hypothetical protein